MSLLERMKSNKHNYSTRNVQNAQASTVIINHPTHVVIQTSSGTVYVHEEFQNPEDKTFREWFEKCASGIITNPRVMASIRREFDEGEVLERYCLSYKGMNLTSKVVVQTNQQVYRFYITYLQTDNGKKISNSRFTRLTSDFINVKCEFLRAPDGTSDTELYDDAVSKDQTDEMIERKIHQKYN